MGNRTVVQRLASIAHTMREEAQEHRRYGRHLEAATLEHCSEMVGEVQKQARAGEEAP
ncbi:hypothetical protein HOP61_17950 [Halomonas daqingensis]|uniref:Uncharacterized protein n=1 Tax=Billgrantia desiderata TaxID=52021 RepID=A0AAW4Z0U1_9GAMM|nr:hypothetical protein [Halomonas desiderata]MCE8053178.1 hypothetical protein [Halomonas desiderata]